MVETRDETDLPDRMKREVEILIQSAVTEHFHRYRSYLRFVTAGNAGGLFAVLSVIGATTSGNPDDHIRPALFYIVLLYVTGLAGALASMISDVLQADHALASQLESARIGKMEKEDLIHFLKLRWIWGAGAFISLIGLSIGTVWALGLLHAAAGYPWLPFALSHNTGP